MARPILSRRRFVNCASRIVDLPAARHGAVPGKQGGTEQEDLGGLAAAAVGGSGGLQVGAGDFDAVAPPFRNRATPAPVSAAAQFRPAAILRWLAG
jgi:hypothetical protein